MKVENYSPADVPQMAAIWNEVVKAGEAFPQEDMLNAETGENFFAAQTCCGVARGENGAVHGLYILHPNNIGRCGHICNASYAVASSFRGQGIGEELVKASMADGKAAGFRILQFNAVVTDNLAANKLYRKLGFTPLGIVPGGFRDYSGTYKDIQLYFIELS